MIRSKRRKGFTLIEMLGTLAVLLAVGVAAVSILGAVTEIGVSTNENRQGRISVERLAAVLRNDVSRAVDVDLSDDGTMLNLTTAGASVHYQSQQSPPAILRRVVRSDSKTAHDRFALPSNCNPAAMVEEDRVVLHLSGASKSRRLLIEASRP